MTQKSEAKGVLEKEAPVSNTIGRVGAGAGFGWSSGTESEAVSTTAAKESTVAVGSAEAKGSTVVPAPMRETVR